MTIECAKCNKTDGTLLKCGGCNLGIYYCSKECQKAHWKTHKVDCKFANLFDIKQTKLELTYDHDDKKVKDYDAALKFAKRYMKNVDHLVIHLRQAGMWKQ